MKRKIVVEIAAMKQTCGKCRFLDDYTIFCTLFRKSLYYTKRTERRLIPLVQRCQDCLDAEKAAGAKEATR